MNQFKKGDKVRFIDEAAHRDNPGWFPAVGTIGTHNGDGSMVQWPAGSTSQDDLWCCESGQIVKYTGQDTDSGLGWFVWNNMPDRFERIALWWKWVKPAPLAPTKRTYTPAQIAEARDIVYRIMTKPGLCKAFLVDLNQNGSSYDAKDTDNAKTPHVLAILLEDGIDGWKEDRRAVAFCAPDDEWNDDIGRMVALCKLTGTAMPDWVNGGKS